MTTFLFRFLFTFGILLLSTGLQAAQDRPRVQQLDRIVAIVNNDVITQRELTDRIGVIAVQLKKQGTPLPPQEILEKQVLERMIVERAQLQYAQDTGIRVDDAQVDATLQRIAQQNNVDLAGFRQILEKEGINFAKFREELRNEIIIARLREREVDNKITVADSEVDNLLAARAALSGGEDEYNVAHILISVPENASPEQIQERKAKAEAALAELKKGANFGQVAASFSDAPDAMDGGQLGWRSPARLPGIFAETLGRMKAGEVSQVLRSPNGFHILKLMDLRSKNTPLMVQQTHVRHILIKTNEAVSEADAKRRLTLVRDRLVHGGDFAQLARLYSEDGSASRGGDLGWVNPGDLVPEFEQAMNALKPGDISEPVKTPFGWHLIQVQERRTEDMSKERTKLQARQEIRARKADEQYQDWVRQLRDRAFVEYRLEDKY
jgi:peptidyl-prolyl cis-trans isomerase SurA